MRYANRFTAHLDMDDPRTPLTAAGGCNWPTIPAHRYQLHSGNAVGVFDFLNNGGVILERTTADLGHDSSQWTGPLNDVPVTWAILVKSLLPGGLSWSWIVGLWVVGCPAPIIKGFGPYSGPCNVSVPLGNMVCANPSAGETGSDLYAYQVEWNQLAPP